MKRTLLSLGLLFLCVALPSFARAASPPHGTIPDGDAVYLPLISHVTCSTPVAPGPFGTQMFGNTDSTNPYYPYLINSGAQWLRILLPWSAVEPTYTEPRQYRWDVADRIVGAARDACLNLIVIFDAAPLWASTNPSGPLNHVDISVFTAYVRAVVERYDGDGIDDAPGSPVIKEWEFYNEPDALPAPGSVSWGDVGAQYAQMLAAVYPVVKAANPQAQVVFGGIAYDWFDDQGGPFRRSFLDDVLSAGGGAFFDVMNFHAYPQLGGNWTTNGGPGLYEKSGAVRSKLQAYGLNKPIIITETGDHNNGDQPIAGSDESQMRNVVKLYTQSLAAGIQLTIWFTLYDLGGDYAFNSGLITNADPPTAKPAYLVYQNAVKELSAVQFDRVLTQAETKADRMEAYRFIDVANQQTLFIAWLDPIDASGQAPLRLKAAQATVRDLFGTAQVVNDRDDKRKDGWVTIQISGRPVYIEIKE